MKKLFVFAVALAAFALRPTASAQSASRTSAVMTVDSVNYDGVFLSVTGVPRGEQDPVSVRISFNYADRDTPREYCQRLLLLALAKPGQYLVTAGQNLCRLQLVTP